MSKATITITDKTMEKGEGVAVEVIFDPECDEKDCKHNAHFAAKEMIHMFLVGKDIKVQNDNRDQML